jgi:ABC-type glycerol-3-phosphate transport system permease component
MEGALMTCSAIETIPSVMLSVISSKELISELTSGAVK